MSKSPMIRWSLTSTLAARKSSNSVRKIGRDEDGVRYTMFMTKDVDLQVDMWTSRQVFKSREARRGLHITLEAVAVNDGNPAPTHVGRTTFADEPVVGTT